MGLFCRRSWATIFHCCFFFFSSASAGGAWCWWIAETRFDTLPRTPAFSGRPDRSSRSRAVPPSREETAKKRARENKKGEKDRCQVMLPECCARHEVHNAWRRKGFLSLTASAAAAAVAATVEPVTSGPFYYAARDGSSSDEVKLLERGSVQKTRHQHRWHGEEVIHLALSA